MRGRVVDIKLITIVGIWVTVAIIAYKDAGTAVFAGFGAAILTYCLFELWEKV